MQEIHEENGNGLMLVGIGASAGGINALLRFFDSMPSDGGLAFAVLLHTTPDRDGHLAEVLKTKTTMPVLSVTESVSVEPNCVYIIPPDKSVSLTGGHIRLGAADIAGNGHSAPIDFFFRTLAHTYRDKAIAVVLSGAGADGSLGLGRIREEGGVSIAQDPSEAEHSNMPRSAIETGFVDFILPVAAIPAKLVSLRQNAERITLPQPDAPTQSVDEEALRELLALLRARTRNDFANYKRSTLLRRIERRLQVTESEDLRAYLDYIRKHQDELHGLLRDLLISVTNFFRDPEAWRRLQSEVMPKLFEGKGGGDQIRVWVTGCATGEEAYSIAMLLSEHADTLTTPPTLQIFATDIDEDALAHGRAGVYPNTIAADVSPERLKRFFVKEGQYYRVKRELREVVLFAPHNILRDPPFSKLNLISCRNLLIYINRNMQERVLEVFHFALKPDGYLFLGSSESAEGLGDLFTPLDKKYRIFKRTEDKDAFRPAPPPPVAGQWVPRPTIITQLPTLSARPEGVTYGELHYRMLESLAPPSVLVNADYDILHLSEQAGRYLRLSGGEPTRNLLKVAHPDLRLELRSLLLSAVNQGTAMSSRVVVNLEGARHYLGLTVRPLVPPHAQEQQSSNFMLVLFEESDALAAAPTEEVEEAKAESAEPPTASLEPVVRQLETELERTREQLRATVEEYETSTEELKASNEELQAMNEELRSASEELETGKEELQSVNEELTTLNTELREKVEEIGRSNSDLQNLMASTQIATLFLDRNLRLKRYTPSAQELFNIIPGDVGRPLAHITHKLEYPSLDEDVEGVIRTLHTTEREVSSHEGRHFLARLLPYRTTDDKINGVVLTFTEITERKRAEEALAEDLRDTQILQGLSAQFITDGDIQALYDKILDAAIEIARADAGTIQMLDVRAQELVALASKNIPPEMVEHFARVDANSNTSCGIALKTGQRVFVDFDAQGAEDKDGSHGLHREIGLVSAQSTPLVSRSGKPIGMFSTHWRKHRRLSQHQFRFLDLLARQAADLIEQRQSEEALRESEEKYRTLFNSIDEGFLIHEMIRDEAGRATDLRLLEVNPAFTRQTGLGSDTVGKRASEFLPNLERFWIDTYDRVARTGTPEWVENYNQATDRWYSVHVSRVGGDDRRVAAVFEDITERKRREANLAFLAEVSQDLAHLKNIDETMDALGAKIGEYFNVARVIFGEIIEDHEPGVVNHEWHAADLPSMKGSYVTKDYFSPEFEMLHRRGETAVVRDTAQDGRVDAGRYRALGVGAFVGVPLIREGKWRFYLSLLDSRPRDWRADEIELMRELTNRIWTRLERARVEAALRLSEERLRLVLESSTDYAIMLMDADGRYTNWNTGAERMFGYTKAEVLGEPTALIFTPEDREAHVPEKELRMAEREGRANDERWHMRKDGSRFYVSGVVVALREGRGYAKIARDLTMQKEAQDKLQRAWEELDKAIEERRAELASANSALKAEVERRRQSDEQRLDLLRRIVTTQEEERRRISRELHDQLGQSLTALRLKLEGLNEESGKRSKLKGRISELVGIAQRLDRDVDFLAWELRPTALDDLGLIVALANYTKEWEKHFNAKVNFHSAGLGENRLAPLIETTLYRIAQEALNNTSKYAEATNIDVLLERRNHDIVLIIEDNGHGFDPEEVKVTGEGRSMGLVGMRERAALVNGSVEIESVLDEGTTVFVRVPAKTDSDLFMDLDSREQN